MQSVCNVGAELGEGPVWFDGSVWFVDIKSSRIHRFDPATKDLRSWHAPEQPGWIYPVQGGKFLVGLQTGLHSFDPADASFQRLLRVDADRPSNRLNDATIAPDGRLWFGTMDDEETLPSGAIYQFDGNDLERMIDGICITNGPAFSPDGRTLYHCDTRNRIVYACAIEEGLIVNSAVFTLIDDGQGYPDGPVVDAEGCLWLGLFDGWAVRRYDPSGRQMSEFRLPVANVTKVALTDDGTAYVTTAWTGLNRAARRQQPLAGNLFAFEARAVRQSSQLYTGGLHLSQG